MALPLLGYALFIAAAAELWLDHGPGLETVGVAMLVLLAVGIRNAWDLVLWMAQQPRT